MTFVGQPIKRFEDPRLLTGQGSYVDDLKLPGLLHAVVLRSLHAHANIRSIDVSAASRVPGVVAVFTAADIQDLAVEIPTRTNTGADEFNPPRHPVLASDKVCYGKGKFSRSIHSRTDSWSRSLTPKTEIFFAAKSEWLSRYP